MATRRSTLNLSLVIGLSLGLAPACATSQMSEPSVRDRQYLADGIYEENHQLVFERPNGRVVVRRLGTWSVLGNGPLGQLIALVRTDKRGREIQILDRSGKPVGKAWFPLLRYAPSDRNPVVTDQGILSIPMALHAPVTRHELSFYSLQGRLLRDVSEPSLVMFRTWPEPYGDLITLNKGPGETERTVIVYNPGGQVIWRYAWQAGRQAGDDFPDVAITPDHQRVVFFWHDVTGGTTDLAVMDSSQRTLQRHHLPNLYASISSTDSRWIAAAGQHTVVLVDAHTGNVAWRRDEDIDFVARGGLRFNAEGTHLLIVAVKRNRRAGTSRLSLRSLRLSDGAVVHHDLGAIPLDSAPTVRDIVRGPTGTQLVLHNRVILLP